ncbi:type IV pilus modification PilV family protein [Nocardioides panaciterrulae]|uniref:Prepilin-type N-terminal cleavage/methylation domain-containing protein n=1 Tax=Nocardioides panaciterrulae TaxID=661492 RepID=A0A7Y9E8J1_9ACTN|nr:prepilin-type N-terminal cleavage/methylation domain-containing protein [Nocardioides panaciterrulae]NYD42875.1 prepilin-type N-terminal cleavage/methylation domain-containing protein [Nocardioides panaciterrulae]
MAEPRNGIHRRAGDAGFTLIEVIVALGIFVVIVTALLPMFVGGIRSVAQADHEGVVKGLLQQEVEQLRGLPYRVSLGASGDGTDADVDLLDLYYPNVSDLAPVSVTCPGVAGFSMSDVPSWKGYVGAGAPAAARCSFEPPGAFFRTVVTRTNARLGPIAIVRDLQFLSGGTLSSPTPTPKAPSATYDSAHATTNYPPSTQVGVTVSVVFTDRGTTKVRSLFSQIEKRDAGPTLVTTKVDAQAVEISSLAPGGATESLSGGGVSLAGSVGDISTANVSLSGVVARTATGDPTTSQFAYGAAMTVSAPPSVPSLTPVDVTPVWGVSGCTALLCYGTSHTGPDSGGGVLTDGGLPKAGSSTSPLRAAITDTGGDALRFDNVGASTAVGDLAKVVVRLVGTAPGASTIPAPTACPQGAGASARLSGAGYLDTVLHDGSETLRDTAACASTRSAAVGILPTSWAPDGVLKVTINRSFAWCTVTGGVANGGIGLSATVQVSNGDGTYQPAVPAQNFVLADAKVSDAKGMVSNFITGWSYGAGQTPTPTGGQVRAEVPGIQVTTAPTRYEADGTTKDLDSSVVVTLGAASCSSESTS